MNAFYLIDKPLGITSFDVIRKLRKILNIKKMWHTWTLDPLATGGLLIATWNYTKLIPYFEKDTKVYEFEVNFDWKTDSYDLWTEVCYIDDSKKNYFKNIITYSLLEDIIKDNFLWEISQIPPKYSALKIDWKRALEKVREGENFDMKSRKCFIYDMEILELSYPKVKLLAKVSAWTYIRSIANDMWEIIWSWAYITSLRRIKIWELDISNWLNIEEVNLDNFVDIKKIFLWKEFIELPENILKNINNWLPFYWKFDYKIWEDIFVFSKNIITNIVYYDWEKLIAKRKII